MEWCSVIVQRQLHLYAHLIVPLRATFPVYLIAFDLFLIIFYKEYTLCYCSLFLSTLLSFECKFLLYTNVLGSDLFLETDYLD